MLTAAVLAVFGSVANLGCAAESATNNLPLIPEKTALLEESMLWDKDVDLRADVGYNDNILLAPALPHGSPFVGAGLDVVVFRLPLEGPGLTIAATGDALRYLRPAGGVDGEAEALVSAQAHEDLGRDWQAGLELKYLYLDQVVEELVQTGGGTGQTVEARGQSLELSPSCRRDLGSNWWAQVRTPVAREWWQAPLDDDWRAAVEIEAGRRFRSGSRITLELGTQYTWHQQWLARSAEGAELAGVPLQLWRQSVALKWDCPCDAAQRWHSTARLGFQVQPR